MPSLQRIVLWVFSHFSQIKICEYVQDLKGTWLEGKDENIIIIFSAFIGSCVFWVSHMWVHNNLPLLLSLAKRLLAVCNWMVASLHRSNLQESPPAHSIAPTMLPHVIFFKKHMKTWSAPASVDLTLSFPPITILLWNYSYNVVCKLVLSFLIYLSN